MTEEQMRILAEEAETRRQDYRRVENGLKKARDGHFGSEQTHLLEFLLDVLEDASYDDYSVEEAKKIMAGSINQFRESLDAVQNWLSGAEAESNFMFEGKA